MLPWRLIGMMILIIFVAELAIMLGFFLLGKSDTLLAGLVDAGLLALLITPAMYYFIFRPMTQQQQRLRQNRRWLHLITENLPDPLIACGNDGKIREFNPAAERLFGHTEAEMQGKPLDVLMSKADGVAFRNFMHGNSGRPGLVLERDIRALRRNGDRFPAQLRMRGTRLHAGMNYIALVRDQTDLRHQQEHQVQMQERIERTQRLESLGVLAGGIAHDFNNILAAIMGNAELLRLQPENGTAETRQCLERIESGCKRANGLCRQMLAYAGQGQYRPEYINLNTLLSEMDSLIRVAVPVSIKLEFYPDANLPTILADKSQIEQAVLNLVTNAAEAIDERPNGRIVVSTRLIQADAAMLGDFLHDGELSPGLYVLLKVRDNGGGIAPEHLPRLFEPFFTTRFTGRGLGMSAVLGILQAHHGGIAVESEPGVTTVRVLLPVRQKKVIHPVASGSGQSESCGIHWTGSGTVLVIDDERSLRDTVCRMLQHLGFDTVEAKNGEEGLEMAARHRTHIVVVLLDLTMPVMGGEQTFLHLRGRYPELPVVIASGYGESKLQDTFGNNPPEGYVSKPFSFHELRRKMHEVARLLPTDEGGGKEQAD